MHGLNTIKSTNETAVREAREQQLASLRLQGKSYRISKDALGNTDIDAEVFIFNTAAELKANTLATVRATDIDQHHLHYGSN